MNKRQLIDEIRRHNLTAQPSFLEQFDEEALKEYLDVLQTVAGKRLRFARLAPERPEFRMVS